MDCFRGIACSDIVVTRIQHDPSGRYGHDDAIEELYGIGNDGAPKTVVGGRNLREKLLQIPKPNAGTSDKQSRICGRFTGRNSLFNGDNLLLPAFHCFVVGHQTAAVTTAQQHNQQETD